MRARAVLGDISALAGVYLSKRHVKQVNESVESALLHRVLRILTVLGVTASILAAVRHANVDTVYGSAFIYPLVGRVLMVLKNVFVALWYPTHLEKLLSFTLPRCVLGANTVITILWAVDDLTTFSPPNPHSPHFLHILHPIVACTTICLHLLACLLAMRQQYTWDALRALELAEAALLVVGLCIMRYFGEQQDRYPAGGSFAQCMLIHATFWPLANLLNTPANRMSLSETLRSVGTHHVCISVRELPTSWLTPSRGQALENDSSSSMSSSRFSKPALSHHTTKLD